MDFNTLMSIANDNKEKAAEKVRMKKYAPAAAKPQMKAPQSAVKSDAIKKFLQRKDYERRKEEIEAAQKKEDLLSLRAAAKHNRRATVMARRTKDNNFALTFDSQELPDDEKPTAQVAQPRVSLPTKVNVVPGRRENEVSKKPRVVPSSGYDKRPQLPTEPRVVPSSGYDKRPQLPTEARRDSSKAVSNGHRNSNNMPRINHKSKSPKLLENNSSSKGSDKLKFPVKKPLQPPSVDFNTLLKLANTKQYEPIVIPVKEKLQSESRPMTQAEKEMYLGEKARKLGKSCNNTSNGVRPASAPVKERLSDVQTKKSVMRTSSNSRDNQSTGRGNGVKVQGDRKPIPSRNERDPAMKHSDRRLDTKPEGRNFVIPKATSASSIPASKNVQPVKPPSFSQQNRTMVKSSGNIPISKPSANVNVPKSGKMCSLPPVSAFDRSGKRRSKKVNVIKDDKKSVASADNNVKKGVVSSVNYGTTNNKLPRQSIPTTQDPVKRKVPSAEQGRTMTAAARDQRVVVNRPPNSTNGRLPSNSRPVVRPPIPQGRPMPAKASVLGRENRQRPTTCDIRAQVKQFPPPDLLPIRSIENRKMMVKKPISSKMSQFERMRLMRAGLKRPLESDDDDDMEEEEEDDMDDFIDDGPTAEEEDYSKHIREIFGYDKRRYAVIDRVDDTGCMESSFARQMQEEAYSARVGLLEDLEDIRKEQEELEQKYKKSKKRKL